MSRLQERPPETEDSKEGNVSPRVRHDLTRRVKEAIRLKGEMLCKHLIEEHYVSNKAWRLWIFLP